MTTNLRHIAGSVLVVGLSGPELTGMERAWLKLVRPAGIILFRRNIADARQTRSLLEQATALCTPHAVRYVDVEGGTVDRLRDALASTPSVQAVALAAQRTGKTALIREHGELVARAVKAFGFNTSLAPVVDLALPASAQVMGTRAASPSADDVTEYASYFLAGLAAQGIVGCGKHFPGLGGGSLDSHLETPAIHRTMKELDTEDLVPYRRLCGQMPIVMINHAAYPATPGRNRPASVSAYWIQTVLRKRIGYRGIVLSDDLEMGGILKYMPIEQAAIEAIRVGSDLVEVCHSAEMVVRAWESLLVEAERSQAFHLLLLKRSAHTARQLAKLYSAPVPAALSAKQLEALRTRILRFSETIAAAKPAREAPPA